MGPIDRQVRDSEAPAIPATPASVRVVLRSGEVADGTAAWYDISRSSLIMTLEDHTIRDIPRADISFLWMVRPRTIMLSAISGVLIVAGIGCAIALPDMGPKHLAVVGGALLGLLAAAIVAWDATRRMWGYQWMALEPEQAAV
jgi:hypothetical protein